jgi:hypothetical protein
MSQGMANGSETRQNRWSGPLIGVAGLAVVAFLAFRFLNPIIAAALVIVAATVLGIATTARGWDQHPSFEEREAARARKRAAKWARGQGARDKDRARWEAHQARQARRAERTVTDGQ